MKDRTTDVITASNITFPSSGSGYMNWESITGLTTNATYTGNSNKSNSIIQIKQSTPTGIVTTASAGRAKMVKVFWSTSSSNSNDKSIGIYGKNTPYTSGAELYTESTRGKELGTITYTTGATSGSVTINSEDNYAYIAIYAKDNKTFYIDEIRIQWEIDKAPVVIGDAEYATYVNATKDLDFSATGITVYTATAGSTSVTLNEVMSGKVPANTPVVLYKAGADGTAINVPVAASADAIAGTNDLAVSDGSVKGDGSTIYALAKKNNVVGFYLVKSGESIPNGKAYLTIAGGAGAPEFLGFSFGDVTAIKGVEAAKAADNGAVFNLAGQRVAQPSKGLYIVNGKKVIIK